MKPSTVVFAALIAFFPYLVLAQSSLLQSGPMAGYSSMQEVGLWVQTTGTAEVSIRYWPKGSPHKVYTTNTICTDSQHAFTAHLVADSLQPGQTYLYRLYINKELVERPYELSFQSQPIWKWRTDAPDFSFALGSCMYINEPAYDRPGKPYGRGYDIFNSILDRDPDFMLWLGDNVYLREADWNSRSGILGRYTHDRATAELQPLLGSVHHFAIWDDHDYGPNNSDRSFWNKDITAEAFRLFWRNPNYGLSGEEDVTGTFLWHDVQFFLMDDRWFRAPNALKDDAKPLLGSAQLQWLKDALLFSDASFKIIAIGSQVLSTEAEGENYMVYPEEREELISFIQKHNIPGVLFLSGDRHFTELSVHTGGGYPLYDLTVSPLTSGVHPPDGESNVLRVPETLVTEQNFAVANVTGAKENRKLTLSVFDDKGKVLWEKSIYQNALKQGGMQEDSD
ncbi:MAG: alkaline phosphatase D family protein [Cyclobacteriaceae bacterium]